MESNDTNETYYCIGCGAKIQTTEPTEVGYTPAKALAKGIETEEIYCQRCFRLRHYNEIVPVKIDEDSFLQLLNQLGSKKAVIVNVVDIFDFNGSVIPGLHRFVGNNPVILVGNKIDVLPKSLKPLKIENWLRGRAKEIGLQPAAVMLTSAERGKGIEELLAKIDELRQDTDVYVVGATNVGKSTLINKIISQQMGIKSLITTSRFPGTTLDRIEIPIDDGHSIIDTPGIIQPHQMAHFLGAKDLRLIAPNKEIKPKAYQLAAGQTLFFGGVARFDYIKGDKKSFVAYFDNQLLIHRTKLENADAFYEKHVGGLLQPPRETEVEAFPPLVRFEFSIKEKSDLVIAGLGWLSIPADCVIAGYAPKGVDVLIRKALI